MRTFSQIIGASCKYGQPKIGVETAPELLKDSMAINMPIIDNFEDDGYTKLFNIHNKCLSENLLPITIGGDHSISFSTVASSVKYYQGDLTLIWVDAHADIHTRDSSETKNMHGMPVGGLLGHDNIFNFPELKPQQLIYIGLRDVDEYEQQIIDSLDIEHYTAEFVRNHSLSDILENIYNKTEAIHLSLDVDVMDPIHFGSTGTPVEDGLSIKETKQILSKFKPKIKSVDFVEFNPSLTNTAQATRDLETLTQLINIVY
tara:strand:+ start:5759 stop:6535 length:777 start_codon:yes stop_codon:yes gene_type:complete